MCLSLTPTSCSTELWLMNKEGVDHLKSPLEIFSSHVAILMKWGVVAIDQNLFFFFLIFFFILVLSIVSLSKSCSYVQCAYILSGLTWLNCFNHQMLPESDIGLIL